MKVQQVFHNHKHHWQRRLERHLNRYRKNVNKWAPGKQQEVTETYLANSQIGKLLELIINKISFDNNEYKYFYN